MQKLDGDGTWFTPSVFTPNNNIPPKVSLLYFLRQTGAGNTKCLLKEGKQ